MICNSIIYDKEGSEAMISDYEGLTLSLRLGT